MFPAGVGLRYVEARECAAGRLPSSERWKYLLHKLSKLLGYAGLDGAVGKQ